MVKGKRLWAILGSIAAVMVAALLVISFVPGINAFGVYPGEIQAVAPSSASPDSTASPGSGGLVAIFMPTKALQRWSQDSTMTRMYLEPAGYTVDLLYSGENDVPTQIAQIETEITKSPKVLVIFPIDGSALGPVLEKAKKAGIPVISYNKLITGTSDVDYFITFDSYKAGILHGRYIEDKLALKSAAGPFTIELFASTDYDAIAFTSSYGPGQYFYNSRLVYEGAMSVLQPYIDSGKLVVKSHHIAYESIAMHTGEDGAVQGRMDALLKDYYSGIKLDAILSPDDATSFGIIAALKKSGYGVPGKPFPVLTGQGCDKKNVQAILAGEQSMSVFIDTRTLDARVVEMVDALMQGKEVPVNDTASFNNGVKVVPTLLCDPMLVDKANYKNILIDSGYYTKEQLGQ